MGCWFWGCLTVVILLVAGALGLYFGVRYYVRQAVMSYSTTEPLTLPALDLTQEHYAGARGKVEAFAAAMEGQEGADRLVLSSDDINALIIFHPDMGFMRDRVFVDLRGNEIRGRISIPLEAFGFAGRFVNADGKFFAGMVNGQLRITPLELSLNGKALPAQLLKQLQNRNLTDEIFKKNPEAAQFFNRFESISVADGMVTLVLKKTPLQKSATPGP